MLSSAAAPVVSRRGLSDHQGCPKAGRAATTRVSDGSYTSSIQKAHAVSFGISLFTIIASIADSLENKDTYLRSSFLPVTFRSVLSGILPLGQGRVL